MTVTHVACFPAGREPCCSLHCVHDMEERENMLVTAFVPQRLKVERGEVVPGRYGPLATVTTRIIAAAWLACLHQFLLSAPTTTVFVVRLLVALDVLELQDTFHSLIS